MAQQPSINDNEVNLWKKLVLNTSGISPVPPPPVMTGNFIFSNLSNFTNSGGDQITYAHH